MLVGQLDLIVLMLLRRREKQLKYGSWSVALGNTPLPPPSPPLQSKIATRIIRKWEDYGGFHPEYGPEEESVRKTPALLRSDKLKREKRECLFSKSKSITFTPTLNFLYNSIHYYIYNLLLINFIEHLSYEMVESTIVHKINKLLFEFTFKIVVYT
jgi:hypothetical protein